MIYINLIKYVVFQERFRPLRPQDFNNNAWEIMFIDKEYLYFIYIHYYYIL